MAKPFFICGLVCFLSFDFSIADELALWPGYFARIRRIGALVRLFCENFLNLGESLVYLIKVTSAAHCAVGTSAALTTADCGDFL